MKTAVVTNKTQGRFFYIVLVITLIFLGLIASDIVTLNRPLLIMLGMVAIGAIFISAMADLSKFLLIFTLYLPFSRFAPGDFGTGLLAFNLTNVFLVLMIIALCMEKMKSDTTLVPRSPITIPLLMLCFWAIASFIKAGSVAGSTYFDMYFRSLKQWLTPMVIFLLFLVSVKTKEDVKRIVALIMLITICVAFLAIWEYLGVRGAEDADKLRIEGIFQQSNRTGAFFVYYPFLLVGFFLVNIASFRYWLLLIPIMASARALLYTYSRGAMVAFGCAALFIAFVRNKLVFIALCIFIVLALLFPGMLPSSIAPSSLYDRFSVTFTGENNQLYGVYDAPLEERLEPSSRTRIVIWKGAIQMIKDNLLFGVGYGMFSHYIGSYALTGKRDAHSTYLTITAELGIIGLLMFLWILLLIFKNTWFVYKRANDRFIQSFALGFLAGVAGFIVCNIFGGRMDSQALMGPFWILTAMIFKCKEMIEKGEPI